MEYNYDARHVVYIAAMKEMFKKIPLTMIKALTRKQKSQKIMEDIVSGCYTEIFSKGLTLLKISKLSKTYIWG